MTAQLTRAKSDAMTTLDLTPKFDVTFLPCKIEELLAETEKPLHRAILKNYFIRGERKLQRSSSSSCSCLTRR